MRLASVRIAERDVYAGEFFVLQQDPDHFGQAEIRSKCQFAHAIAVLVRVAILPEFFLQVFALAFHFLQPPAFDRQRHRRCLQIAVLSVEVVARRRIAHESSIHGRWRRKNFSCRQV